MENIIDALYKPYFSKIGFAPANESFKYPGLRYEIDPSIGKGFCWIYPVDQLFAITVNELVFNCDISLQYEQNEFLNVGSYDAPMADWVSNRMDARSASLVAYVGHKHEYRMNFPKDVPVRSIGINLMPVFYKEILPVRFSEEIRHLPALFSMLDGGVTIPEVEKSLNQIRAYRPSGRLSRMYFEGKVLEIVSLIMQWGMDQRSFQSANRLPDKDLESLELVRTYVRSHIASPVPLVALSKMACMSTSKLTNCFKRAYGVTISEYMQMVRIEKSKELLLHSNRGIKEIAQAVGYNKHASFSELFKRVTGFTPHEFRRNG